METATKLAVRDRVGLLFDEGSFVEHDVSEPSTPEHPGDALVTGVGKVDGRDALVIANDSSVKAGSWGASTVEKIIRATEYALEHSVPIFWLVDSAGARITEQIALFPGKRGAGRIFYNQIQLSGKVPQICCLMGPSAAGGAYVPAFCDVVIMVEGNASMYLGSPRMAEMVIGEKVSLEEMGGARMHASISGCGDVLVNSDEEAIDYAKRVFSYLPINYEADAERRESIESVGLTADAIPLDEKQGYDIHLVIDGLVDADSFCELKQLFAPELVIGFARLDGHSIGVVANNPAVKGGVLFGDSADKAARFVWWCDAFNVPLLFLADVPGFMVGSAVEKQGIIRHGAKMITAMSEATVPKVSVIVRKAYGAGLYAMAGPAFGTDAVFALPSAKIAVMGPEAAVNAVYAKKIDELPEGERSQFIAEKRQEYEADVDLSRLVDADVFERIVEPSALRGELIGAFAAAQGKPRDFSHRRHGVPPV